MTRVYRILRKRYAKAPFDGEGAYRYGGRWSSPGVRLTYASEHLSLAMIEYFVHLDQDDPPPDLVVAAADVPDDVSRVTASPGNLPAIWRQTPAPAELAAIGDRFSRVRRHAILVVPSALAPDERNWLLNPDHPDFRRVRIYPPEPFAYDAKILCLSGIRPIITTRGKDRNAHRTEAAGCRGPPLRYARTWPRAGTGWHRRGARGWCL